MDDTIKTPENASGRDLGNSTGMDDNDELTSLPLDDEEGDPGEDDDMSELPDTEDDSEIGEDGEIDLPGSGAPEVGDDRGRRIVQDPMMDDAANLPYSPSR